MTTYHPETTSEIVAEHGLSADEYKLACEIMDRAPNLLELGIFSVMWSEHCSYKSSKKWLKTLPTEGPQVIQGPGENAGVVDIGDGDAVIFKIESHNHPSFIEPYQGAATGVGGILRDVFTMGARPIANLNALRFGDPDHPKTRHLLSGVVAGIGGYGNCVGVPTVGGETNFDPAYNGNILVNAMNVGVAKTDKIFYSAAGGIGNSVVYVGSKTGRDGIHGATMASAEFDDASEAKRPTVQVGDPFTEKLLIEACLEIMSGDSIVAIQDMGAAGLCSSSFEMASKGGTGVELNLSTVPCRETGMTPYEMMLSESQERMLMVLKPGREAEAQAIFEKWELDFAVIGTITDTGRMVLKFEGETVGDLPIDPLALASPEYDRPWHEIEMPAAVSIEPDSNIKALDVLKSMMGSPDLASRRWIWEQYDSTVMADTMQKSGGDAAVVRVHDTQKALAMTTDCTPRYCYAHPETGGAQAVAEAYRNLVASGARPLAATNNLNFGNPEKPEIMGQIVGCVKGIGAACEALDMPIVSGNVSLYNETDGKAILPTPVIGGVGLMEDSSTMCRIGYKSENLDLIVLGSCDGHLQQSLFAKQILSNQEGQPPAIDLEKEEITGRLVLSLIENEMVEACHDISDGGLLVSVAEMAMANGIGAKLNIAESELGQLFGEDQARYVLATNDSESILLAAENAEIEATIIGKTKGDALTLASGASISLSELSAAHEAWMPGYMEAPVSREA
ncbi:phosphoribosylformylglycinamidine synthase subunit PurL [Alphaproteobacteria bacterium]|nr:phosphoribosylformylglycinamidine synthase subunit PurL [Alphaproteobacteria bacterium]